MTEAITRCPECGTTFRITEEQLLVADGSVRCGACLNIFQAEDYFVSPLLDKTERLAIARDYWADFDLYVTGASDLVNSVQNDSGPTNPEEEVSLIEFYVDYVTVHTGRLPEALSEVSVDQTVSEAPDDEWVLTNEEGYETLSGQELDALADPDFELGLRADHEFLMQDRRRLFSASSLKWLPGIILMLLVALGQFAYFNMDIYSQSAEYRPVYLLVCRYIGCEVPEYEDHDALRTRELVIRSHPEEADALLVDVLLRNSAPFRQSFPGLRLQFFDVHGETVASRVFRASEYLGGEMRGLKTIPAETEVRLSLELQDPGNNALGYQMDVVRL